MDPISCSCLLGASEHSSLIIRWPLVKAFFFTIMQKEAMEILAKKGADLEQEDIHGDTPFGKRAYPYISKFNWVNIVYKEECTNLSDVCTDL